MLPVGQEGPRQRKLSMPEQAGISWHAPLLIQAIPSPGKPAAAIAATGSGRQALLSRYAYTFLFLHLSPLFL